jgi:DNA polymerase III delta subunit
MPLTAFVGNDDLRKDEGLEAALAAWEAAGDCVRETHFAEEMNAAEIAQSYESADLFAPRKSLILRNWDKAHAAAVKTLEPVFLRPNDQVGVFFVAEKWDARNKLRKAVQTSEGVVECKLPYDNKIPQWLTERAKGKYNRRLPFSEARLLQDIVGNDLAELDRELEKLDTFLPKGEAIGHEAILALASPLKTVLVFEFQKVMGLRDKAGFLPALRHLLDEAGDPPFLLAMRLLSHFTLLARFRSLSDSGQSEANIANELKLNSFLHLTKERYGEQARSRSLNLWKKSIAALTRLERDFKRGRYPQRFETEMAFASLL